jgi:hypothetical protein
MFESATVPVRTMAKLQTAVAQGLKQQRRAVTRSMRLVCEAAYHYYHKPLKRVHKKVASVTVQKQFAALVAVALVEATTAANVQAVQLGAVLVLSKLVKRCVLMAIQLHHVYYQLLLLLSQFHL